MNRPSPTLVTFVLVAILGLSGCSSGGDTATKDSEPPAAVEQVGGQTRIRLTPEASKRLDVQTARTGSEGVPTARLAPDQPEGAQRTVVPFDAVLYAPDGAAFVYTNPEPFVFHREAISIDYVDADKAVVSTGPAPGTPVVVVGSAELFGAESGIGAED